MDDSTSWPSDTAIRKKEDGHRLVLVETKYGDGAITDVSGIHSHIDDINHFLSDAANVQRFKNEMVELFNLKRDLGLINCNRDIVAFSDEPPMLLLALVNHDPKKTKLREALASLPQSPHAEIHIATSCFMGYGLFDQAVVPLEKARSRFEAYI